MNVVFGICASYGVLGEESVESFPLGIVWTTSQGFGQNTQKREVSLAIQAHLRGMRVGPGGDRKWPTYKRTVATFGTGTYRASRPCQRSLKVCVVSELAL